MAFRGGFQSQQANPLQAELEKKQWSEHRREDGRPYWYNSSTKQSVWEKPAVLKSPEEKLLDSCPWKEHIHAETGRKYYYNVRTKTSEWVKPKELEEFERILGKAPSQDAPAAPAAPAAVPQAKNSQDSQATEHPVDSQGVPAAAVGSATAAQNGTPMSNLPAAVPATGASDSEPRTKDGEPADCSFNTVLDANGNMYPTKEEAREAFKQLLTDENVASHWAWDKVKRSITDKPRWNALKREGEKKQCWRQWQPQRSKIEKEEKLKAARKIKNELRELILMVDEIDASTTYRQAAELLRTHYAFRKLTVDRDRQEVFKDAIHEKEKSIKAAARELQMKKRDALVGIIASLDMPPITIHTTWDDAKKIIKGSDAFKSNSELQENCHDLAILDAFKEHMRALERAYDDKLHEEKMKKRRSLRQARDGFQALLNELEKAGCLDLNSLWKDHYATISSDDRYTQLLEHTTSKYNFSPLDLFKLKIEALKDVFFDELKILKSIMKDKDFQMTKKTTLEEFHNALCDDSRYVGIPSKSIREAHKYFVDEEIAEEAKQREREEHRKRRMEQRFTRMLGQKLKKFSKDQAWDEVCKLFEGDSDYEDVKDPDQRKKLFEDYIATDPWAHAKRGRSRSRSPSRRSPSRSRSPRRRSRSPRRSRSRSPVKKKSRRRSRSPSASDSDEGHREHKKHKKHKKEKKAKKEKKHKKEKSKRRSASPDSDSDAPEDLEKKYKKLLSELKSGN